jgi:hypothetical protein
MAKSKTRDSYNVNFSLRDDSTNDDIKTVNMNWENRSVEETVSNLNTWLNAIGLKDVEVVFKSDVAFKVSK